MDTNIKIRKLLFYIDIRRSILEAFFYRFSVSI